MDLDRTDSISSLESTHVTQLHHTEFGATMTRFPAMPLGRSRPSLQPWYPRPFYSFGYSSSQTQLQSNPLLYMSCCSPYVSLYRCPLGFLSSRTELNSLTGPNSIHYMLILPLAPTSLKTMLNSPTYSPPIGSLTLLKTWIRRSRARKRPDAGTLDIDPDPRSVFEIFFTYKVFTLYFSHPPFSSLSFVLFHTTSTPWSIK